MNTTSSNRAPRRPVTHTDQCTKSAGEADPIGYVDLPANSATGYSNAVRFEGWALDKSTISKVTIERKPRPGDLAEHLNERRLVLVGEATRLNGVRPDVAAAHSDYPELHRARWTFELRREVISVNDDFKVELHVIAHGVDGKFKDIGHRLISFVSMSVAKPYLFCERPFDSVYIAPNGDVNPYPDCRPEKPYGSLQQSTLETIWFGQSFTELRTRIINRDPPPMCLTCAHFINNNVNDPEYFATR